MLSFGQVNPLFSAQNTTRPATRKAWHRVHRNLIWHLLTISNLEIITSKLLYWLYLLTLITQRLLLVLRKSIATL
jgi:hypothetical protein